MHGCLCQLIVCLFKLLVCQFQSYIWIKIFVTIYHCFVIKYVQINKQQKAYMKHRVSCRCFEHGEGSSKFDRRGLSQYMGVRGAYNSVPKILEKSMKNTCEGVHLSVQLLTISLQACNFAKNKLLHIYFSRTLARF